MKRITMGAFFGPFRGVSFSLLAVQHTQTGIAATLMAISLVLIILPAITKKKLTGKRFWVQLLLLPELFYSFYIQFYNLFLGSTYLNIFNIEICIEKK